MNESDLKLYRDYETLNQLQKDLQNLKIRGNNNLNSIDNLPSDKLESTYLYNYDYDMPEIIEIPSNFEKNKYCKIFVEDEIDNDTNDSSDANSNFANEIPYITQRYKIKDKIIDNAIKSEKTLNKIFKNFNPSLQPNHE